MAKKSSKKKIPKPKSTSSKRQFQFRGAFLPIFWKPCLVLLALVLFIYGQTYNYEYVLDDQIVITDNSFTQQGFSGVWNILSTESMTGYFGEQKDLIPGARYRPLSIVSFAIEHEFFGLNSGISHMINLVLYFFGCLLLFRLLTILFPVDPKNNLFLTIAFVVAIMFTIHPLHTEVVANVKGRDEILSFILSILALISMLKAINKQSIVYAFLSSVYLFLALLAKENAITFLFIIPITIYFFSDQSIKKILTFCSPILFCIIIYLFIRYQIIGYLLYSGKESTDLMNNPFIEMNFSQKYATIAFILGQYVKLSFIPHPLTHDYYPYHIPIMSWSDIRSILSLALYLAMAVLAIYGLKKKSIISYSILFFIATISISSNIFFNVGTFMNERFMFTPLLGFNILLAFFILQWIPKRIAKNGKIVSASIIGIIAIVFSLKSAFRVPAWKNPYNLNSNAVKVSKNSSRANTFMATAIFNKVKDNPNSADKLTQLEDAYRYIEKASSIAPNYGNAILMKAGIAGEIYRINRNLDQLLSVFKEVALKRPGLSFLHEYHDYLNSASNEQNKLFQYYFDVGYKELYFNLKQLNWSLTYLNYGYQLYPDSPELNRALGNVYSASGNQAKANFHFEKAKK